MIDRRRSVRRRTLLEGRIEVAKLNGWATRCAVRNRSEGGARIALDGRTVVPQGFTLGVSDGAPRPARLVWYRDGQAGVAFAAGSAG